MSKCGNCGTEVNDGTLHACKPVANHDAYVWVVFMAVGIGNVCESIEWCAMRADAALEEYRKRFGEKA